MKISFLTLLLILGSISFAQTHQLVKHDGTAHVVNFIKNENNIIFKKNLQYVEDIPLLHLINLIHYTTLWPYQ